MVSYGFALAAILLLALRGAEAQCDENDPPTYDGTCNNVLEPLKGAAFETLLRTAEMRGYLPSSGGNNPEDFIEPRPTSSFNPRTATESLIRTPDPEVQNPKQHDGNLMMTFFGQFLSHDQVRTVFDFPPLDQQADLIDINAQPISGFTKMADIVPTESIVKDGYREQLNGVSSVLDLNHVYGNNATVAAALRSGSGGRLKTTQITTEFDFFPVNHRDFRLCQCYNTETGEPWHTLDDVENLDIYQIQRESLEAFTPEPVNKTLQKQGVPQPCFSFAAFCIPPEGFKFSNEDSPQCQNAGPPVNFPIDECNPEPDPTDVLEPFPGIVIPPQIKPAIPFGVCFEPARRVENIECFTNTAPEYSKEDKWVIPPGRDWPPLAIEAPGVPFDTVFAATFDPTKVWVSGDDRSTENVGIFLLHNLYLREHNYQAGLIEAADSTLSDEEIFQEARRRTTASFQMTVYNEWLPVVIGEDLVEEKNLKTEYYSYDPTIDPSTANIFSTAAFRFGHSTVPLMLYLRDPVTHERILNTKVQSPFRSNGPRHPIVDQYHSLPTSGQIARFALDEIFAYTDGEDTVMAAMLFEKGNTVDNTVSDTIHDLVISSSFVPFGLVVDVPSQNIRRGRNHGLPGYDTVRSVFHPDGSVGNANGCSLVAGATEDPLECFEVFCETTDLAERTKTIYGTVDNVDAWVGMLLEAGKEKVEGGLIGVTQAHIIAEQMLRTRDGDRFFLPPDSDLEEHAEENGLKELIERHHGVADVPDEVFLVDGDDSSSDSDGGDD